jgi:hypothetical protein
MNRVVKIISPQNTLPSDAPAISVFTYIIPITNSCSTIYDTVDSLKNKKFLITKGKNIQYHVAEHFPLQNVLNIHNDSGIKDLFQIRYMVTKIQSGEDIFTSEGLPNIKLVRVDKNHWLLFDGHHSMLAYMHAGKKYLHEVAHFTVENEDTDSVSSNEISVFFGSHANKIRNREWKSYVINWQAPINEQLCSRIQKNMGELYDALASKIVSY